MLNAPGAKRHYRAGISHNRLPHRYWWYSIRGPQESAQIFLKMLMRPEVTSGFVNSAEILNLWQNCRLPLALKETPNKWGTYLWISYN